MTEVSNRVLSDENMIVSGIQKGSFPSNGVSALSSKWKPRNVFAVRDFPPECGPILEPVNLFSAGAHAYSLFSPRTAQDSSFPRRRISAIRDFPPYCGLNAAEPTEEERVRINGKISSRDEDKNGGRSVTLTEATVVGGEESKGDVENGIFQNPQLDEVSSVSPMASQEMIARPIPKHNKFQNNQKNISGHGKCLKKRSLEDAVDLECIREEKRMVPGLMALSVCPLESVRDDLTCPDDSSSRSKINTTVSITPKKYKKRNAAYGKKIVGANLSSVGKVPYTGTLALVVRDDKYLIEHVEELREDSHAIFMPPFGPKNSNYARNKVRETLRLFQAICRKLLQGEEAKTKEGDEPKLLHSGKDLNRIDLAAIRILKDKGNTLNMGSKIFGPVPGVEVGDEFQYRVELALVGIHRLYQAGIDYIKQGKDLIAVSIVASGGYDDELDNPDCLIYSGSGGTGKDKKLENQKLERGNLALKNNAVQKHPVRVIRGFKGKLSESSDLRSKLVITYVYDGMYTVERYWQELGKKGNLVFKYELKRIPGQPEIGIREVKKSKKVNSREGLVLDDITHGKEMIRICAINTIDNEKPPPFNYVTKMIYPDWYHPMPPKGCDCVGRCSNKRCSCTFKNGGEIPYNHNGAIVEVKPLVYECGPYCKCPPSCYNRVTQKGMKIQLEIFKTGSRGWGVRSLNSISSGSFICEYIGELLEETEAEKRTGNDEYLFDIGQNGGFTIDAANYGNVGRFINHSCSPNLYAQNVLYDHEDKRMPHIMLFAADNIPPLQELTYHYNYAVDTVHDSDGNIKTKSCYCGSAECTGRLY